MLLAGLVMGAGLSGLLALFAQANPWVITLFGLVVGGGLYTIVTLLLKLPEPLLLLGQLKRRLGRF